MQTLPIPEPGVVVFIPASALPQPDPPPPAPAPGAAPLPATRTIEGWPTWIAGVHTDGVRTWYLLHNDAMPDQERNACYERAYDPGPPTPPPTRINRDGVNLWEPKDNQQQVTCRFDPIPWP
jgi:hypothetical protein